MVLGSIDLAGAVSKVFVMPWKPNLLGTSPVLCPHMALECACSEQRPHE